MLFSRRILLGLPLAMLAGRRAASAADPAAAHIARFYDALLAVMKGLPLAYQKDLQEDKEPTIEALNALELSVAAMTGMVDDVEPDAAQMKRAAASGYSTATDLADWLVRTGMPFREAHHVTGRIVAAAEKAGVPLHRFPLEAMRAIEPRIDEDVVSVLTAERSVRSRTSYGGTAPANVRREARKWLKRLQKERK